MTVEWLVMAVVATVVLLYAFADTSPRGHRISFWTVMIALIIFTAMEHT